MQYTVAKLAETFDLTISGDRNIVIEGVCGISDNKTKNLSFLSDKRKTRMAEESDIPVYIVSMETKLNGKTLLHHHSPEYIFCLISELFSKSKIKLEKIQDQNVRISQSCNLHPSVEIGFNVVVGEDVEIGSNTKIYPNCVIMDRCKIGNDCTIYPNCTVREDSVLGNNVILQAGVSIGGDGYGFLKHGEEHVKIPQLGNVVISYDVEIGANSTIDRGRFSSTFIGKGTKIDNLVMVGHNVSIGENCLIVSQTGISGSTEIGDRVTLAGQVGTVGHVQIGSDVTVLGKGGVTKSLLKPGIYAGMPARPAKVWRKAIAKLYSQKKDL